MAFSKCARSKNVSRRIDDGGEGCKSVALKDARLIEA